MVSARPLNCYPAACLLAPHRPIERGFAGQIPDICAVVAHEIGHSKLHHNYMMLAQAVVQLGMTFFTYGVCAEVPTLVSDFGFDDTCTFLKLNTFFLLYNSALSPILGPLNWCANPLHAHVCCMQPSAAL